MRRLHVFVDYRGLDFGERGFLQHGFYFGFGETGPLVGVEFSGFFKTVLDEVEDYYAAAADQDSCSFAYCAVGVQGVVQGL